MNIRDFTYDELESVLLNMGERKFRTKQVFSWAHKGITSFDEMTNLSLSLRERLQKQYSLYLPQIKKKLVSAIDGTVKYLFSLEDGNQIETVVMRYHHGLSICISSQVGCAMGCQFCASTLHGKVRNLTPGELEGQILAAQNDIGERISNVVLMGIGEPLDNYEAVLAFFKNSNHPDGLNIGLRHFTLSTCGLVEQINRLAKENLPITLAVSLHAPNDEIRKKTMPVAKVYPMDVLLNACKQYVQKTGRRITFEYATIHAVNDGIEHAQELAAQLKGLLCHVNLIPVNPVQERQFERGSRRQTQAFCSYLNQQGIEATIRRELGADINASCGQLRNSALH